MQSAQFPTFQTISIFLQIRLDVSNCHIFPPCFTQMKWKIEGSSGHKHERTLQFFTFSQLYTVHTIARRKKNQPDFSHVCMCGLGQTNFPTVIYAYIQSRWRGSGQAWRTFALSLICVGDCVGIGIVRCRWRDRRFCHSWQPSIISI